MDTNKHVTWRDTERRWLSVSQGQESRTDPSLPALGRNHPADTLALDFPCWASPALSGLQSFFLGGGDGVGSQILRQGPHVWGGLRTPWLSTSHRKLGSWSKDTEEPLEDLRPKGGMTRFFCQSNKHSVWRQGKSSRGVGGTSIVFYQVQTPSFLHVLPHLGAYCTLLPLHKGQMFAGAGWPKMPRPVAHDTHLSHSAPLRAALTTTPLSAQGASILFHHPQNKVQPLSPPNPTRPLTLPILPFP